MKRFQGITSTVHDMSLADLRAYSSFLYGLVRDIMDLPLMQPKTLILMTRSLTEVAVVTVIVILDSDAGNGLFVFFSSESDFLSLFRVNDPRVVVEPSSFDASNRVSNTGTWSVGMRRSTERMTLPTSPSPSLKTGSSMVTCVKLPRRIVPSGLTALGKAIPVALFFTTMSGV